jgi:HSP20 family protein
MANSLVRSFGNGDGRPAREDEGFGLWREIDRVFDNLARSFGRDNDASQHKGFARDVLAPQELPEIPLSTQSRHAPAQHAPAYEPRPAPAPTFEHRQEHRHMTTPAASSANEEAPPRPSMTPSMQAKSEVLSPQPTPIRLNRAASAPTPGPLTPVADAFEDEDTFEIHLELAGVRPDDIDIEFAEGGLNITAERRRTSEGPDDKKHHVRERSFGTFKRRFPIPFQANPDIIQAAFEDGVVLISVPRPPETKPRIKKIGVKRP